MITTCRFTIFIIIVIISSCFVDLSWSRSSSIGQYSSSPDQQIVRQISDTNQQPINKLLSDDSNQSTDEAGQSSRAEENVLIGKHEADEQSSIQSNQKIQGNQQPSTELLEVILRENSSTSSASSSKSSSSNHDSNLTDDLSTSNTSNGTSNYLSHTYPNASGGLGLIFTTEFIMIAAVGGLFATILLIAGTVGCVKFYHRRYPVRIGFGRKFSTFENPIYTQKPLSCDSIESPRTETQIHGEIPEITS